MGFFSACRDNPARLTLSLNDAIKNEVGSKQYLKSNGKRVLIDVAEFYSDRLKVYTDNDITRVLVPLDATTIETLREIEAFVCANVDSPMYKPLRLDGSMYVMLSKWCQYLIRQPDGTLTPFPCCQVIGEGLYGIQIQVSHVYIGPHRGGETFSLSLHVTRVVWEPQTNLLDGGEDEHTPPPASAPPTPTAPLKKPKRKRKRVALDETDGPKTCTSDSVASSPTSLFPKERAQA